MISTGFEILGVDFNTKYQFSSFNYSKQMSHFTIKLLYGTDETVELPLEIGSDDNIHQVKQKIENKFKIKIKVQELFLGDKKLENDQTVKGCKISLDEKIRLVKKAEGSMQVFINDTSDNGKSTAIIIKPTSTVLELKQNYDKIPIEAQRLIFQGKQLEDHKKLSDYGIVNESDINLVARLPGGL
ncbi:7637_t:CDS:1 [Diversispora eburnea]|uniref:7637_t:CDS:1 n=1 Tax=Diversispora eburnea TaxID=1213867 RepID=A0A9N9BUK3_9GLOM|nr:7637_t:CDS:1 [Diversispora eburnea]